MLIICDVEMCAIARVYLPLELSLEMVFCCRVIGTIPSVRVIYDKRYFRLKKKLSTAISFCACDSSAYHAVFTFLQKTKKKKLCSMYLYYDIVITQAMYAES